MILNTRKYLYNIRERHKAALGENPALGLIGSHDSKATVDRAQRYIYATATTSSIDMDNEVVVPGGADWSYLGRNRSILVDHQYDFEHYVGKLVNWKARVKASTDGSQIAAWDIQVYMLKENPWSDDILSIAEDVGIGLSIGFQALDWGKPTPEELKQYGGGRTFGSIVRKYLLREVSFVAVPCNVDCQTMGVGGDGKSLTRSTALFDALDNMVTKGRIKRETAQLFGFERKAPPVKAAPVLKRQVLTIEDGLKEGMGIKPIEKRIVRLSVN